MNKTLTTAILATFSLIVLPAIAADDRFAKVEIQTINVTDNIYMLVGAGGNIGISNGADGMLMIDDQYEPLSEKIKTALSKINKVSPTFLLNTHYHGDHTGGNANFSEDSIIMAHHNVRVRLLSDESTTKAALPVITYADNAKIHFNGEQLDIIHKPHGHTDGDSMVHFTNSNVVHMGDNFFNGKFPFVDTKAGGSVDGLIDAISFMLEKMNADTKIIPGHGPLADKSALETYQAMLKDTRALVKGKIADGKSQETIIQEGVSEQWNGWGENWFITEERWLQTLFQSYQ